MTSSEELLDILACPLCKEDVQLTSDNNGLRCIKCHRIYPIQDDIPVMLVEEATLENTPPDNESDKN